MTVGELSAKLSASELYEWMAYDRFDPIGGYRQDIQTAHLLYAKYRDDDNKISDFLPIDPNPMTDEQRVEYEKRQQIEQLRLQTERLQAMFDKPSL